MRRVIYLSSFFAIAVSAPSALGQYINGYAVANHRACSASNLPATITELDKFFASRYFPLDTQKNVYYRDAAVNATHWASSTDMFESSAAASGFDGADAPLISYIASHGVTSSAKYTALAGGSAGGCNIRTTGMAAGDHNARYFVLSTCQGLKIGTGSNPGSSGDNPSVTWKDANKGLNCIFGYSNNMVDASEYGNYFLENLATSDETLAQAFMRASRRISSSNIPAVLCFGADNAAAKEHLETSKRFTSDRVGSGGSSWTYTRAKRVEGVFDAAQIKSRKAVPRVIKSRPVVPNGQKTASSFLGPKFQDQSVSGTLHVYRTASGTVTVNRENGFFSWVKAARPEGTQEMKLDDAAAVRVARAYLANRSFLAEFNEGMATSYVVDRFIGNETGSELAEKIVVLSQTLSGVAVLGSAGTVEVTVGAEGEVRAVSGALIDLEKPRLTEWLASGDINVDRAERTAMAALQRKVPGAKISLIQSLIGFDSGDYSSAGERMRVVAEVLLEAEEGGFARRYIERMPL
jgi:hypothetical protein